MSETPDEPQPEVIAPAEANESINERPGLHILWKNEAGIQPMPWDMQRLQHGTRLVGLDPDVVASLALVLVDEKPPGKEPGGLQIAGTIGLENLDMRRTDGNTDRFAYSAYIYLRDEKGERRPTAMVNKFVYHELTHIRQLAAGTLEAKMTARHNYNDPREVNRAVWRERLGLARGPAIAFAAAGLVGPGAKLAPAEMLPMIEAYGTQRTIGAIGIGILALAATAATIPRFKNVKERVANRFHNLNAAENEARANEHLAEQYPIFAVATP